MLTLNLPSAVLLANSASMRRILHLPDPPPPPRPRGSSSCSPTNAKAAHATINLLRVQLLSFLRRLHCPRLFKSRVTILQQATLSTQPQFSSLQLLQDSSLPEYHRSRPHKCLSSSHRHPNGKYVPLQVWRR